MARSGNALVSFAAGFGSGYLNGQKQKEEKKRQDELDKIRIEENERARADFEDKQNTRRKDAALNEELTANSAPTYANKTNIAAEGLTAALPKVFTDDAEQKAMIPNMVDESRSSADGAQPVDNAQPAAQGLTGVQKANHFMANSTPEQQARFSNFYAKQGLSATGNEVFTKDDKGELAVADKADAKAKPIWQTMQDRAMTYLTSENSKPEYQAQAFQMIKQATEMKSEEYMNRITEARKGGLPALMALANSHDNSELPITDAKVEMSPDGKKATVVGVDPQTGKPVSIPLREDIDKVSAEDQITLYLSQMASPTAMLNGIARNIQAARDNRKEDRETKLSDVQLEKYAQDIKEGKIKLESLPESIKLDLAAKRANINQSNAATAASFANTEKTKLETRDIKTGGGKQGKLPSEWQIAKLLADPTVPQAEKDEYFNINGKEGVVQNPLGGYVMTKRDGSITAVDEDGKKTVLQSARNAPKDKPEPPKQQTYGTLWK